MLGMLIFIAAEVMFFAGVMSAFTIVRATTAPGMWPPPGQPILPAIATAWNTLSLLLSGALAFVAYRRFRKDEGRVDHLLLASLGFGALFVALQGAEWLGLVEAGLTVRSSALGSFFYLLVGGHALHAVCALGVLAATWAYARRGRLGQGFFAGATTFWLFVVGLWPIIYARVYF
jgi:cytochrome c oxidase subunit 3